MSTIFSQHFYNKYYVVGCYWQIKKLIQLQIQIRISNNLLFKIYCENIVDETILYIKKKGYLSKHNLIAL